MTRKPISEIAAAVQASSTLALDAQAKKMKAEGLDIVGFGAGEPDFNTPDFIKEAGVRAIYENKTRYTPVGGTDGLKKAICARLSSEYGLEYAPGEILVSPGAKYNLYVAISCLVNPGDEVILPAPYWVSYYEIIKMAGGVPVVIDTGEDTGFKITADMLRATITGKSKLLILNNPSNPTGMVYDRAELEQIARVCVENSLYVIADEIYSKLIYDNREFVSFASLGPEVRELTILINGVSKTYAMTGWRIGFTAGPADLIKVMTNFQSHSTSNPCSIAQEAAEAAYVGSQDEVEAMRRQFEKRRDFICEQIGAIPGLSCVRPGGAFYVMVNIKGFVGKTMYGQTIRDGDDFARLLLEKQLVAAVPCSGFGAPDYLRFSYAKSMDEIDKGIRRLAEFCAGAAQ